MPRKMMSQSEVRPADEPDENGISAAQGFKIVQYDPHINQIPSSPDYNTTDPDPYAIISPSTWRYIGRAISLPSLAETPGAALSFTPGLRPGEQSIIDGAVALHTWAAHHVNGNLVKTVSKMLACVHETWMKKKSGYDSYVLTIHAHTLGDFVDPAMPSPAAQPLIWRTYADPALTPLGPVLLHAIARPMGEGTWFQVERAQAHARLAALQARESDLVLPSLSPVWQPAWATSSPLFDTFSPSGSGSETLLPNSPPQQHSSSQQHSPSQQLLNAARVQLQHGDLAVFYGTDAPCPAVFATPDWAGSGLTVALTLGSMAQVYEHLAVGEFFDNANGTVVIGGDLDRDVYERASLGAAWPRPVPAGFNTGAF